MNVVKRFKVIFFIGLGLFMISPITYFIDIEIFFWANFFLGYGLWSWLIYDYKILQSNRHYVYCLLITIAFGGYCLLLKQINFSAFLPLMLLLIQRPSRLIYKVLLNREPVSSVFTLYRFTKIWSDLVYTVILIVVPFILSFIVEYLLK